MDSISSPQKHSKEPGTNCFFLRQLIQVTRAFLQLLRFVLETSGATKGRVGNPGNPCSGWQLVLGGSSHLVSG